MITLNGFTVISLHMTIPWRGVWVAEADVDVPDLAPFPLTGPAILLVNDVPLRCAIDPRFSGVFGSKTTVRLTGGLGGWDKPVPAKGFEFPGGPIPSSVVYAATGLEVGEAVVDPTPVAFPEHYERSGGAASRVFGDRDWHVEPITGITMVAPWLPLPLPPDAVVGDYFPEEQRVVVFSDTLIFPGSIIVDQRSGVKTFTARDVEQTWSSGRLEAQVWVSESAVSPLQAALKCAVREFANTAYLKTYKYRFILPVGSKLALQSVTPDAPDLNPIDQWTGLSGSQAVITPGTEIVVGFVAGDPSQPYLVAYAPLTTDIFQFLAHAPSTLAAITALQTEMNAVATWIAGAASAFAGLLLFPPLAGFPGAATPLGAMVAASTTVATAIGTTGQGAVNAQLLLIPTTKVKGM